MNDRTTNASSTSSSSEARPSLPTLPEWLGESHPQWRRSLASCREQGSWNDLAWVIVRLTYEENLEVLRWMLKQGPRLDTFPNHRMSGGPLFDAVVARENRLDLVRCLIEAGADVNAIYPETQQSVLMVAAEAQGTVNDRVKVMEALLDAGADPSWKAEIDMLGVTSYWSNALTVWWESTQPWDNPQSVALAHRLVNGGANATECRIPNGWSLVTLTAFANQASPLAWEALEIWFDQTPSVWTGANLSLHENGNTPLHHAASNLQADNVAYLLKHHAVHGVDSEAKNRDGQTPKDLALIAVGNGCTVEDFEKTMAALVQHERLILTRHQTVTATNQDRQRPRRDVRL